MGLGLPKTDEGIIEMYQYSSTFGVIVLDTKDGAGKDVYGTVNLDYGDYVWFEFRIEDDNTVTGYVNGENIVTNISPVRSMIDQHRIGLQVKFKYSRSHFCTMLETHYTTLDGFPQRLTFVEPKTNGFPQRPLKDIFKKANNCYIGDGGSVTLIALYTPDPGVSIGILVGLISDTGGDEKLTYLTTARNEKDKNIILLRKGYRNVTVYCNDERHIIARSEEQNDCFICQYCLPLHIHIHTGRYTVTPEVSYFPFRPKTEGD